MLFGTLCSVAECLMVPNESNPRWSEYKERDTVPASVVALSNDVSAVAGYSRGLAEGVGTEK
jgi:hypothetical protein